MASTQPAAMTQTPTPAPSTAQPAETAQQQTPSSSTIVAPVWSPPDVFTTPTPTHPAVLAAFSGYSIPVLHPDPLLSNIYYTERHGLLIDDAARASTTRIRNTILSVTHHLPVHPRDDPARRRIMSLAPHVPLDSTRNLIAQAKHYGFVPLSSTVASFVADKHSLLALVKDMYMRIEVGECVVPEQLLAWEFEMAVEFGNSRLQALREWADGEGVFRKESESFEAKTALGRLTGAKNLGARVRVAVGRAEVLQSEGLGEKVRLGRSCERWVAWCVGRGAEKDDLVPLVVEMELVKRADGEDDDEEVAGEDVLEVSVWRGGKCVLLLQSECQLGELGSNLPQSPDLLRDVWEFDAPATIPLRVTGVIYGLLEREEQRAKSAELEVLIVPGVDEELFMKLSVPSFLITDDENLKKLVWCWGTLHK